jgi:hypothetical protein
MKDPVSKHKLPIIFILILFLLGKILSLYIDTDSIILSGEYIYSLDYLSHLKSLLRNIQWANPDYILSCKDCGLFYHYSWWYSVVIFSIASIGEILNYNPFVFYLVISLSVQFIGIYLLRELFFKKVPSISVILSFLVFSLSPYKITLFSSGSWYGFNHGILTIVLVVACWVFYRLSTLKAFQVALLGIFLGVLGSFFTSISINYLPIAIYSIIVIATFYLKSILKYFHKAVILTISSFLSFCISSLPFIYALFSRPSVPSQYMYTNSVNNESLVEAVFVRAIGIIGNNTYSLSMVTLGIIIIVFIIISRRSNLNKIYFLGLYSFIVYLLMGSKATYFNLAGWMFDNIPLMSTIRSTHRFYYFLLLLLSVGIFLVYERILLIKSKIISAFFLIVLSLLIVITSIVNINYLTQTININKLPNEYFQVAQYFENIPGKKIYFPSYMPTGESMSGNYYWFSDKITSPTLYINPFNSLLLLPDLITFDGYPFVSLQLRELRSLVGLDNSPEKIVEAMERRNIEYVIIDNNFMWSKYYPDADLELIKNLLTFEWSYGDIEIYRTKDTNDHCDSSYGRFDSRYCQSESYDNIKPNYLIDSSKEDYLLNNYSPIQEELVKIEFRPEVYDYISNTNLQEYVTERKIRIDKAYTIDNRSQRNTNVTHGTTTDESIQIFMKSAKSGVYELIIPILKIKNGSSFFQNAKLDIEINGQKISEISPLSSSSGLMYERIDMEIDDGDVISGSVTGTGSIVIGGPFLIKKDKVLDIITDTDWNPIYVQDDVLSSLQDAKIKINNVDIIEKPDLFETNSGTYSVNIDLLNDQIVDKKELGKFTTDMVNGKILYNTHQGDYVLSYKLQSISSIKKISVDIGTYFLNSSRLLFVQVINPLSKQILYESDQFSEDLHPRTIDIPILPTNDGALIRIIIRDQDDINLGVNLYKATLNCVL